MNSALLPARGSRPLSLLDRRGLSLPTHVTIDDADLDFAADRLLSRLASM